MPVKLRRALLLFAVVLGLAAIVVSFSRPAKRDVGSSDPSQAQRSTAEPELISFSATAQPRTQRLAANRAAAVTVEVTRTGQVDVPGLGLTAAAEPLTPARFDVLESQAGDYTVRFTPAADSEARTVGTLKIVR